MGHMSEAWCWQDKGEPTDLVLKSVTLPPLASDEVLIENHVIGLNPVDWKMIEWGNLEWKSGHIPGVDGMGIVYASGDQVNDLPRGTRVCYHTDLTKNGSFSRYTVVKAWALMKVPEKCTDEQAASFPCPSLTAWQSFQKTPSLRDKKVLVNGAGGSVGFLVSQLLLKEGAELYITAGSEHHDMFYRLGAKGAVDYRDGDWDKKLLSLSGEAFDAAFDTVSGQKAAELMPLLGYYAHIIAIQDRVEHNPIAPFTTCISLHEIALGAFHKFGKPAQIKTLMSDGENLLKAIALGNFLQHPNIIDNFENLGTHLALMKKEHHHFKYLIKV